MIFVKLMVFVQMTLLVVLLVICGLALWEHHLRKIEHYEIMEEIYAFCK